MRPDGLKDWQFAVAFALAMVVAFSIMVALEPWLP